METFEIEYADDISERSLEDTEKTEYEFFDREGDNSINRRIRVTADSEKKKRKATEEDAEDFFNASLEKRKPQLVFDQVSTDPLRTTNTDKLTIAVKKKSRRDG